MRQRLWNKEAKPMIIDAHCPNQPLRQGDHIRSSDGREWTVCYWFLDGVGGVEGLHDLRDVTDEELPAPTAMFREPYQYADLPCVGRYIERI